MSLFKSIARTVLKTGKSVARIGAGIASGGVVGGLGVAAAGLAAGASRALPAIGRSLPVVGTALAVSDMAGITWDQKKKKRKRRKGISGHDLQSFKRVARLIDKFAAPVHHLRKSSFKHKEH